MAELASDLRPFDIGERPHGLVDIGQKHKQFDEPFILMIAMPKLRGDREIGGSPSCTGMLCQTSV